MPLNCCSKKIAQQLTIQFVATILGFEGGWIFVNLLFLFISGRTSFDTTTFFQAYKPFVLPVAIMVSILGCCYISYRFMCKATQYLDDVVTAAKSIAAPTELPIALPSGLEQIQIDLNEVRKQALLTHKSSAETEQHKKELLAYIAHDLKTPLTSILGYLRLLEDEPDISPELIAKYTGIARKKAERLETLINEFFEMNRLHTEKIELELKPTNLSRMLTQITYEFNPALAESNLTWDMNIEADVTILCDSPKLERVVDNLVRNAITNSYPHTKLLFSLAVADDSARICIQNKTATIPPEKLEKLFDQFYRVDAWRSSETGGAGLGLAISKEIAQLHRGTIEAFSENDTVKMLVTIPVDCQKNARISS